GTLEKFSEAALLGLAPARMIHVRIDVGVEAVLVGRGNLPAVAGLLVGELDANDGFRTLEAVLPWDDYAQGCAILIGQRLAVHAETKQRQRVHGFIHPQAFDVGPLQHIEALARHLLGVVEGGEFDKLRAGEGIGALDQFAKGEADPGHYDRPAFDAAMAVDALFGSGNFDDGIDVEDLLFLDQAVDGYRPGTGLEIFRQ